MYQWWPIALLLQQLGQQRMTYCQICYAANKEGEVSSRLSYSIALGQDCCTKNVDKPMHKRIMIVINNLSSHYIHLNRIVQNDLISKYYNLQNKLNNEE